MKCFECKQQIPLESKWRFFVSNHIFCCKHCLDNFNEKERSFRVKRLKEARLLKEQKPISNWLKKKCWTMRICENPKCGKWFRPRNARMRFCCPECCHTVRRNGKPARQTICSCGRHSHYLENGLCGFCRAKEAKFRNELRKSQRKKEVMPNEARV